MFNAHTLVVAAPIVNAERTSWTWLWEALIVIGVALAVIGVMWFALSSVMRKQLKQRLIIAESEVGDLDNAVLANSSPGVSAESLKASAGLRDARKAYEARDYAEARAHLGVVQSTVARANQKLGIVADGDGVAVARGQASRKKVIVMGGVAAAVIVPSVVAIVLVTVGSGQQQPTAPSPAGLPPPQPNSLDSILLGAPQVSTIMGLPSMDVESRTQQMAPEWHLSNPECLGAFYPTQDAAYAGSGYTGVSGQLMNSARDEYRVYEAAVSFPTAEAAQGFVAASADKWKACAGLPMTLIISGGTGHWTFGPLIGTAPKITLPRTRGDGNQCEHVLSAVSAVVLDVVACAPVIENDQGTQIADQMANNLRR